MPVRTWVMAMQADVTAWRRHLHAMPELGFEVHGTAAFVAEKLRSFGCDEVVTGIGRTGVVGLIIGKGGGSATIGLRADMDALPISENTNLPWASRAEGRMHACGHDGHTAMLLGGARYLAETRSFSGRVAVIFQPAEEDGGGGGEMVKDGLIKRFDISKVFGMHNLPGLPVNQFAIRPGPVMAETLEFVIRIAGRGGHAARPSDTVDPIVIGAHIVTSLQTIVSRNVNPLDPVVVSVTKFQAGNSFNVITSEAQMLGTIRSLRKELTALARDRVRTICEGQASLLGGHAKVEFIPSYPATVNHPSETKQAVTAAIGVVGAAGVDTDAAPVMGGEDFSYMLEALPGAYIFIGNGDSAGLHNAAYDFNDEAIPFGVAYWASLAESALPLYG